MLKINLFICIYFTLIHLFASFALVYIIWEFFTNSSFFGIVSICDYNPMIVLNLMNCFITGLVLHIYKVVLSPSDTFRSVSFYPHVLYLYPNLPFFNYLNIIYVCISIQDFINSLFYYLLHNLMFLVLAAEKLFFVKLLDLSWKLCNVLAFSASSYFIQTWLQS